jgi:tetraacyldisaccharide 4'-kinase
VSSAVQLLGRLYGWGSSFRASAYQRGCLPRRRLGRPVVSVGNLTAGGTGKTPLVRWIVDRLLGRGLRPAILTRGYGRRRGPDAIVIPPKPGRDPEPREVGDEAAWLARAFPDVPVGVSSDRYRTGKLIEQNYAVDAFVLDDGFQHLALARDLDMVAIDATHGISDGEILPAGLQREPCSALARADVAVMTRTELAEPSRLEAKLRQVNPRVRIVRARTRLDHLLDCRDGIEIPLDSLAGRPIHAFCGIGNPEAFFRDLRLWGFDVVSESVFPDHYVYRNLKFAAQREFAALLTTEKDAMNLKGVNVAQVGVPVVVCAARLDLQDQDAMVLEEILLSKIGSKPENMGCRISQL